MTNDIHEMANKGAHLGIYVALVPAGVAGLWFLSVPFAVFVALFTIPVGIFAGSALGSLLALIVAWHHDHTNTAEGATPRFYVARDDIIVKLQNLNGPVGAMFGAAVLGGVVFTSAAFMLLLSHLQQGAADTATTTVVTTLLWPTLIASVLGALLGFVCGAFSAKRAYASQRYSCHKH